MADTFDLEELSQALLALTQPTAQDDVLQRIVETAATATGADYAALGLPDETGRFKEFYAAGVTDQQWLAIGPTPRAHGILGDLVDDSEPRRLDDVRNEPGFTGWPGAHPEMGPFLAAPVYERGEVVGSIYVAKDADAEPFDVRTERILGIVAAHAGISLTRARLSARERELTLVDERSRIARDLHDAVAQKLFSLRLTVSAAEALAGQESSSGVQAELASAKEMAASALDELRAVVSELRPPALREDGLVPALRKHLALMGRAYALNIDFVEPPSDGASALSDLVEETVFRIAQEAVHNAIRHARPERIAVRLELPEHGVRLTVSDDGSGFELGGGAGSGHHLGILSMKERARSIGGRLRVMSKSGEGTTVRMELE